MVYKNNTSSVTVNAAYPNPFVVSTTITLNAEEMNTYLLEIYDEKGAIVNKRMIEVSKGVNTVDLDMSSVSSCVYSYSLTDKFLDATKLSRKIVKL